MSEVQEYVSHFIMAYWEQNGTSMWNIVFGVLYQDKMGGEEENVVKIEHPTEGVNSIKVGNEHQT